MSDDQSISTDSPCEDVNDWVSFQVPDFESMQNYYKGKILGLCVFDVIYILKHKTYYYYYFVNLSRLICHTYSRWVIKHLIILLINIPFYCLYAFYDIYFDLWYLIDEVWKCQIKMGHLFVLTASKKRSQSVLLKLAWVANLKRLYWVCSELTNNPKTLR